MLFRQVSTALPTKWGDFNIFAFSQDREDKQPHLALLHHEVDISSNVAVRIHSECITGDLFGSKRCDCGEQFEKSMQIISDKKGLMIYLRQEGRGIGLINKLDAYNFQDLGLDTFEANKHLGFDADERDYKIAIEILTDLNIKKIDLITNNPDKIAAIDNSAIILGNRIPVIIPAKSENENYLKVKKDVMGHLL